MCKSHGHREPSVSSVYRRGSPLLARENYVIHSSTARLDGDDLGEPVHLDENPTVGETPLPTAPSFVIGQAQARILDQTESQRTKERARGREYRCSGESRTAYRMYVPRDRALPSERSASTRGVSAVGEGGQGEHHGYPR